ITGEYAIPLGVWVTREAARKTLSNKPIKFSDKKLMLTYARNLIKKKFGVDIDFILKESVLLKDLGKQKRLSAFI
ncbi:hypothetical protein KY310_04440, partial [Candidatus Woesearchaeota archaeon]|nr:hypothetical protein [Candidatus Woesearchaeota archaeon]